MNKDYTKCPYWNDETGKCNGYNCCLEFNCPNSKEFQPYLDASRKEKND